MPGENRPFLAGPPARAPLPRTLAARYDPTLLERSHRRIRVRVTIAADGARDAPPADPGARLAPAAGGARAILAADPRTPRTIAQDNRGATRALPAGRPAIRRDPHPGGGLPGRREPGDRTGAAAVSHYRHPPSTALGPGGPRPKFGRRRKVTPMNATQAWDLPDPAPGTHAPIAEAEYLRLWLTEIRAGWEEAREEAQWALDAWRASPGTTSYAVYRAAADRADAAQDELADALRAAGSTQHAASKP
jgi:hypothetical protein